MDTSNGNSSTSDSWLFVKKEEEIGKDPKEKSSTSEELEDSDGISVISESEMYKNHSNHQSDNDEKPIIEEEDEESANDDEEEDIELPLTPPVTPSSNNNNNNDNDNDGDDDEIIAAIEYKKEDKISKELEVHREKPTPSSAKTEHNNHGAILLVAMALIIALLYTNISSLKKEFASTALMYEQRIARLEEENQVLKAQLNELIKQLREESQRVKENEPLNEARRNVVDEKLMEARFIERQEEASQKPITKDVWMGGEKEDVVKILDKKYNSLPDYCYFTDESDLFYEYNKENCERKKRKLEQRVKKFHQKSADQKAESVDDIYRSLPNDNSYDDYMSQTTEQLLQSLNDEIQEIKSSRISYSITDNDDDLPFSPNDELIIEKEITKLADDKKKKFDDKKLQKRSFNAYDRQENNNTQDESKKKKKKKSKKSQQQARNEGSATEWHDRRTAAREEARKQKNIDNNGEENWFIKRKNDREIHRLEQNVFN